MGNKISSASNTSTDDDNENLNQCQESRTEQIRQPEAYLADSDSDDDSDYDVDYDSDVEDLVERLRILKDSKQLKQLAVAFLHPELPVEVDSTACGRCYFDRASASQQECIEETEERRMILEEAAALKQAAVDYMHPEIGVVTCDPTATARCYFDRASAPEQVSVEEADDRRMVLEETVLAALERLEVPAATVRCYFDRESANQSEEPVQESVEETEERRMILEEAAALKQAAVDYMHPEIGVVTCDPTATARCYFDRASAPQQESVEESEERRMVLEEAVLAALERLAVPTATARCYFDRTSDNRKDKVERKVFKKVAPIPTSKNVEVKTLQSRSNMDITLKSPSIVNLFGLENVQDDASF